MNVKQVERFFLKDLKHFRGERQGIRRMIEQRVGDHGCLVKMNVGIILIHANGRGIGDEVDVVSAGGKLLAKFGCHDAGAAICGIAGDADSHSEDLGILLMRYIPATDRPMLRSSSGDTPESGVPYCLPWYTELDAA